MDLSFPPPIQYFEIIKFGRFQKIIFIRTWTISRKWKNSIQPIFVIFVFIVFK